MLTCKQVSYLASKKLDESLTLKEQLGIFLHVSLCGLCRDYAKDIKTLNDLMKKDRLLLASDTLSEQARERIKSVVDKALHNT